MLRLAKIAFWLLIFSLPFAKPIASVGGLAVTATDVLFVVTAGAFAIALTTGAASVRWSAFYWFLLIYFAAMLVSALRSADPERSAIKLSSQAYLIALPVLAHSLIDVPADLRTALRYWLAATALVAGLGTLAVLTFALGIGGPLLEFALHPFGTLPPGNYLRLNATFSSPAMLCNYLTVSLLILLVARRLGWVGPATFYLMLAAAAVTALFTLTPGPRRIPPRNRAVGIPCARKPGAPLRVRRLGRGRCRGAAICPRCGGDPDRSPDRSFSGPVARD